jgi:hypothetical protein
MQYTSAAAGGRVSREAKGRGRSLDPSTLPPPRTGCHRSPKMPARRIPFPCACRNIRGSVPQVRRQHIHRHVWGQRGLHSDVAAHDSGKGADASAACVQPRAVVGAEGNNDHLPTMRARTHRATLHAHLHQHKQTRTHTHTHTQTRTDTTRRNTRTPRARTWRPTRALHRPSTAPPAGPYSSLRHLLGPRRLSVQPPPSPAPNTQPNPGDQPLALFPRPQPPQGGTQRELAATCANATYTALHGGQRVAGGQIQCHGPRRKHC